MQHQLCLLCGVVFHSASYIELDSPVHFGFDMDHVSDDIALVFGNEAHGLEENGLIDQWVTIPQSGAAESLNVAMACTVVCFEVARQRRWPSGTVGEP